MLNVIIKTIIIYFSLMITIRLMGKRQIGQLQPFDLVIAIIIAEMAATPLDGSGIPLSYGLTPIITLLFLHNMLAFMMLKSTTLRSTISGKPSFIIYNGIIDIKALKSMDYTLNDITELLRSKDVFDISTVNYAILETNGELSVILKPEQCTPTVQDLDLQPIDQDFNYIIIQDGKLFQHNLDILKISNRTIINILKKTDHLIIKDVFCLYLNKLGDIYIQTFNNKTYSISKALKVKV